LLSLVESGKLKLKLDKILWYKRALESNSVKPLNCAGNALIKMVGFPRTCISGQTR